MNFVGLLAKLDSRKETSTVRCWGSFPGEYGFHRPIILQRCLVILLEHKEYFWKVFAAGKEVWIEDYLLEIID